MDWLHRDRPRLDLNPRQVRFVCIGLIRVRSWQFFLSVSLPANAKRADRRFLRSALSLRDTRLLYAPSTMIKYFDGPQNSAGCEMCRAPVGLPSEPCVCSISDGS